MSALVVHSPSGDTCPIPQRRRCQLHAKAWPARVGGTSIPIGPRLSRFRVAVSCCDSDRQLARLLGTRPGQPAHGARGLAPGLRQSAGMSGSWAVMPRNPSTRMALRALWRSAAAMLVWPHKRRMPMARLRKVAMTLPGRRPVLVWVVGRVGGQGGGAVEPPGRDVNTRTAVDQEDYGPATRATLPACPPRSSSS